MNSGSHPHMRYIPRPATEASGAGIYDRVAQRVFPRDYTAAETQDTIAWLNDWHQGYAARHGAIKLSERKLGMVPELAAG